MTDSEMIEMLAVRVMGWHHPESGWRRECWMDANEEHVQVPNCNSASWNPLKNPADSKMLREKLTEIGWQVTLVHSQFQKYPEDRWIFHGVRLENDETLRFVQHFNSFSANAETEYAAVAKGSLEALRRGGDFVWKPALKAVPK